MVKRVGLTLAVLAVGLGALLATHCLPPADGCTPQATRCNGQSAEICDGEQRWGVFMDCKEVAAQSGGEWMCCREPVAEGVIGHTCAPVAQCPNGGTP